MGAQTVAPAVLKLGLIGGLVCLDAGRQVAAGRQPFVVDDPSAGLINDPVAGVAHLECKVRVFIVCGCIMCVESAETLETARGG